MLDLEQICIMGCPTTSGDIFTKTNDGGWFSSTVLPKVLVLYVILHFLRIINVTL